MQYGESGEPEGLTIEDVERMATEFEPHMDAVTDLLNARGVNHMASLSIFLFLAGHVLCSHYKDCRGEPTEKDNDALAAADLLIGSGPRPIMLVLMRLAGMMPSWIQYAMTMKGLAEAANGQTNLTKGDVCEDV